MTKSTKPPPDYLRDPNAWYVNDEGKTSIRRSRVFYGSSRVGKTLTSGWTAATAAFDADWTDHPDNRTPIEKAIDEAVELLTQG